MLSIPPPQPTPGRHARLPGPESSAYEPMRKLGQAEASLGELLRQLRNSRDRSAVPPNSIEEAGRTADAAAGQELTEATERLAGLAAALHELYGDQDQ